MSALAQADEKAEPKEQPVAAAKVVIDATGRLPEQTIVVPPGISVVVVQNNRKEPVSIRVSKAGVPRIDAISYEANQ